MNILFLLNEQLPPKSNVHKCPNVLDQTRHVWSLFLWIWARAARLTLLTIKEEMVCCKQFNIVMPCSGICLCTFWLTVFCKNRQNDATEFKTVAILNYFHSQNIIHLRSGRRWYKRCMLDMIQMIIDIIVYWYVHTYSSFSLEDCGYVGKRRHRFRFVATSYSIELHARELCMTRNK